MKNFCRCCKSELDKESLNFINGFVVGSIYPINECYKCGTLQTSFKDNDNPSVIYNAIYKSANRISGYKRYFAYARLFNFMIKTKVLNPLFLDKLYYNVCKIIGFHSKNNGLKILDVGCGLGYFTAAMRRIGHNAYGVDLSKEAIQNAISSYGNFFDCVDITEKSKSSEDEKFDIVVCLEIIEHLENIDFFLEGVLNQLKKDGVAIISTPASPYSKEWTSTEPPVHLTQFSANGLRLLGERLDCEVVFYSDKSTIQKLRLKHEIWSKLPGGVLLDNYSVNLDYFDNGKITTYYYFTLLLRYIINIFKFRKPIVVKENNASVGSFIFTLNKKVK
jgi:2-polyprenyl-3-methyl-5-hydroxy-6-metoxy-1,4-benzoquinol methylase